MAKLTKIPPEAIRELIRQRGGCIASDRIVVDGQPVGHMYREEPDDELSGWIFLAGDETQAYADTSSNFGIYALNTVANYDRNIIPLLDGPVGAEYLLDAPTGALLPVAS